MAYLGSSVVVTGGLDGGVFMARKVAPQEQETEVDTYSDPSGVRGVHLDWGSSGSRYAVGSASTSMDGEYGVGAVSCLAATRAANQSYHALMSPRSPEKDVVGALDDEELLDAMEGCRVVAGTTCGDLRVWSVKDVLSAVFFANRGGDLSASAQSEARTFHRGGEGASSTTMSGRRKSTTDFAAGSSLTRLKFSLRGRALSGHRGGVSCVDVPSNVYRPDSVISGGADGLIKLWSLRAPGSGRRSELDQGSLMTTKGAVDQLSPRTKAARSGDALSILSGHGGRILCVKTAWHGDRLLSGGADRTVRVWDLAGSGGKCLHSLSGHFGWVSSVQYWGPNTIISASTDRSIALWDARVRNSPLFTLRHHYASISDVLVGSRTDPIMISAASDGTIAAWDFRRLSDENSQSERSKQRMCKVVRRPAATLYLHDFSSRRHVCGPTLLSRGPSLNSKTVFCVGRDAVIREWDICTGEVVSEHATGHCDTISSFASFQGDQLYDTQLESTGSESVSGTITTSWDGTVRIRRLAR
jgi:WD40 repeat protein